jgi:hypothetical protein
MLLLLVRRRGSPRAPGGGGGACGHMKRSELGVVPAHAWARSAVRRMHGSTVRR